jgi:hypothetical protein
MPRHSRARQFIAEAHLIQTLIELSKQQRFRKSNALMAPVPGPERAELRDKLFWLKMASLRGFRVPLLGREGCEIGDLLLVELGWALLFGLFIATVQFFAPRGVRPADVQGGRHFR